MNSEMLLRPGFEWYFRTARCVIKSWPGWGLSRHQLETCCAKIASGVPPSAVSYREILELYSAERPIEMPLSRGDGPPAFLYEAHFEANSEANSEANHEATHRQRLTG